MNSLNERFQAEIKREIEENKIEPACNLPLNFVFGYGPESAEVVMIGEAPGKDEVRFGRPFVGKAGAILDEILLKTGIKREQLYITNVVKYRLMKEGSKPGSFRNRPVTKREIEIMLPWLEQEINLIKPKLILTLGNVPLRALCLMQNCGILEIGTCHGEAFRLNDNTAHIPLYHPASQIYNRSLKEVFDEDFKKVRSYLESQEG